MTSKLLFTVEDAFDIKGRGVVLTPGYLTYEDRLGNGDLVKLICPDGTQITGQIRGREFPTYPFDYPLEKWRAGIMIADLTKKDVPIGTEVWSI